MKPAILILCSLLAIFPAKGQENPFEILFQQDFSDNSPGDYTKEEWLKDWNNPKWANNSLGYGRIVENDGNKFLEELFPPNTFLLKGSGTQWHVIFPKGYDELYLSYRVKFSQGFTNNKLRGKLPGLSGGKSNNGGNMPNGLDGWSARFTFRGTNISFYVYHPDLYKFHGDTSPVPGKKYYGNGPELQPGYTLRPETWYTVTQRVVLNDPGKANGLVEGFVNGRLCARQTGIRFRDTAGLTIDRLFFSNFLGGGGEPTSTDEYISFDDFIVFTYKPWAATATGKMLHPSGTVLQLPQIKGSDIMIHQPLGSAQN